MAADARGKTEGAGIAMPGPARPRRPWRVLVTILLLGALGVVILTALGVWQVERRRWKLALIDRVESRVHAAPGAAPGPADWPSVSAANDEYRRVAVPGHFLNDRSTLVQAVTDLGGGFWVVTPFAADAGFTVLVNRGFVPADQRDAAAAIDGETTITGLVRMAEPKGGFLRSNDPVGDHWYSRDVAAIAAARGLGETAPYFIDEEAGADPDTLPHGGLTVVSFTNNHLVYALTWFGLALMLAGGTAHVVRDELRARRG
jgi:surfeit locus 1 family protein